MTIPIVPKLLRSHLSDLAERDARIDGREDGKGGNSRFNTQYSPERRGQHE